MSASNHISLDCIPGLAFIYQLDESGTAVIASANSALSALLDVPQEAFPVPAGMFWAYVNREGYGQQELLEAALTKRTQWKSSLDIITRKAVKESYVIQTSDVESIEGGVQTLVVMLSIAQRKTSDVHIQRILDVMPDRFYYKDRQSRFLGGNAAWLKGKGVTSIDEIRGKTDVDVNLYEPGVGEALLHKEQQQMAEGKPMHFREEHMDQDGKKLFLDSIKIPLRNDNGMVIGLAGMTRVVTEQVLIERELIKTKDEAVAANQAKSSFLAIMSHEIRTPMNGIIGCASLLGESDLSPSQQNLVRTITSCGDSLLSLVNDILDYSKIESGHVALESNPFCLRRTVEDVLQIFVAEADSKKVELSCFVPESIPNTMVGDELRLKQILINLIGNALKFTNDGDVAVRVDLESSNESLKECVIKFSVRDSGIGIKKEDADTIFELFQQADTSTTRQYGGTGLGLTICQKLVQLKNGKIWVESDLGEGSIFFFTTAYSYSNEELVKNLEKQKRSLKGKKALIVDDNHTNLHVLKETIAQWGVSSESYSSPVRALNSVSKMCDFDIILVDFFMPEMDGEELANILKKMDICKHIPIVMLTSALEKPLKNKNIDASLSKPIRANELIACMAGALKKCDPHASSEDESTHTITEKNLRILIAEDDAVNQMVCEMMLKRLGYANILTVNNGKKALDAVRKEMFDIVFMDIQMPIMDGLEATRKIRAHTQNPAHPWVIALTAGALLSDSHQALASGMNQFATKPVQLQSLKDVLTVAVEEISRS